MSIAVLFFAAAAIAADARLHVVTSFFPIYCWTLNIAGTDAQVDNLLPMRSEPHDYAFTPSDARKLANADLVAVNGLGLENWLPKFLHNSSEAQDKLIRISAGFDSYLIAGAFWHGHNRREQAGLSHANPHVWLDPQLAMIAVSNILVGMQRADPAHAGAYESNAQAYVTRLRTLDREIHQSLAAATHRAIVTYHDAFPYFARRYQLEIAGVVEQVPEVNPTPKYLARLSRMMRERDIGVIFVGPGGQTRLARQIAADLRVQLVVLDTLESGALSPTAYEDSMRHNAVVLRQNLK